MRKQTIDEARCCPLCGRVENQINKGKNRSGTQRCMCKECGVAYTKEPKKREYSEETKKLAMKMFYFGVSGRGVGKVLGMSKANVYNWIKKTAKILESNYRYLELYWFVDAYNRFGREKYKHRQIRKNGEIPFALVDFL